MLTMMIFTQTIKIILDQDNLQNEIDYCYSMSSKIYIYIIDYVFMFISLKYKLNMSYIIHN